jgi:hypothetical protein
LIFKSGNKPMKKYYFFTLIAASILCFSACKKDKDESPAPVTPTTTTTNSGTFVAKIEGDAFSATEANIMPALGGTIAVMAKDSKGRSFTISIFEKDFPVNKAVGVAYSPSVSYAVSGKTYIANSGTMTITEYVKNSSGKVVNLKGNFSIVVVDKGEEIAITEGAFDVKEK